jgi:hypothetical protein
MRKTSFPHESHHASLTIYRFHWLDNAGPGEVLPQPIADLHNDRGLKVDMPRAALKIRTSYKTSTLSATLPIFLPPFV